MKFRVSSPFGELSEVRGMKPHTGIDLAMPEGTPLRSIKDGIVERIFDGSGNIGEGVMVKLHDGTRAIYGHMSNVNVKVGEHLDKGDLLGLSGNTGNSTGSHLHFGLWKDGEYIDPTNMADNVANLSGGHITGGISSFFFQQQGIISKFTPESVKEKTLDYILDVLDVVRDVAVDLSFSIALIGGGISIILYVAGLKKGLPWAGILFVANILIKFLLGGYL